MAKTAMNQEEQLEDLQRRFTLLEGERKATYETAKLNIQQNKEIIKQMKDENKVLRSDIAKLRVEKTVSVDKQLEEKVNEVQQLTRKHDAMKSDNTRRIRQLDELGGKLNELTVDSAVPNTEASSEMRQIRVLENRLDKAMIKYNEAQSIRKTYEQILKRLKEEGTGFNNQLAAIERTLKSKERDYEELLLLSHDAYHAKEMAQAELHRFEQGVMEERNQRDKEVQDKKSLVQQRVEMNQRLEQRERMLKKQQDLDRVTDRQPNMGMSSNVDMSATMTDSFAEEQKSKVNDYEEAFHRIKEATGVADVNEVIQKFLTQEDTHKNLTSLTRENQSKIDQLSEERRKVRLQVEELKFSSGGNGGRRQVIDDLEHHLSEAGEKYERNRGRYERMAKMLIDMKAGIGHLSEKLTIINLEGGEAPIEMSDETVEEVLQQCELKLSKLTSRTREHDDPDGRGRVQVDDEKYEEKLMAKSATDVRVKLTDEGQDGDDDDDDFEEEMDEDVWNRKHVKYNSEQIMEKQQTKQRKKTKGKKKDAP